MKAIETFFVRLFCVAAVLVGVAFMVLLWL